MLLLMTSEKTRLCRTLSINFVSKLEFFFLRTLKILEDEALFKICEGLIDMLWFKFILGLKFFELVSILFAIVPEYGNEYTTKENKN